MSKDRITLTNGTAPDALAVARSALEHMGSLWRQHSTVSAQAHEGGKETTKKYSRKVLLSLETREGRQHHKKARRAVEQGLERSGFF